MLSTKLSYLCMTCDMYVEFSNCLGSIFIAGGDFNAKHPQYGSSVTNSKGREIYKCSRKLPELVEFVAYRCVPDHLLDIVSSDNLSSDHSPISNCDHRI